MILAIIICKSTGFYNLAISIAFSHDLYGIDWNCFLVAKALFPFYVRSKFAYLNSIACGERKSRSFSRTRRNKFGSSVGGAW